MLIGCELLANAACWIVAGILFGGRKDTQPILSLALLAWVCALVPSSCQRIAHYKFLFVPPFLDDRTEAWYVDHAQVPPTKSLIFAIPHPRTVALDADHIR